MKHSNPVKEELKSLAQNIKKSKIDLKDKQRKNQAGWKDFGNVDILKTIFRHKHIAYSLLKGRSYEQIERPREGNEPDFKLIEEYQVEMKKILEKYYAPKEDVCSSSTGS